LNTKGQKERTRERKTERERKNTKGNTKREREREKEREGERECFMKRVLQGYESHISSSVKHTHKRLFTWRRGNVV
jgi:hypothetical protein